MNGITKRRVGFGALTGLVIAGVIGVNSMNVSGVAPSEAVDQYFAPYGKLTINITDRAGQIVFDPADATLPNLVQPIITVQPCNKIQFEEIRIEGGTTPVAVGKNLMTLTGKPANDANATPYTVQIPSDAVGVHDGTNCGTPAGLLGPNETLEIGLGDYFPAPVAASSASLVIGKSSSQDGSLKVAFGTETLTRAVAVGGATVVVAPSSTATFDTIALASDASQKSRGLAVRSGTSLNLVAPSTNFAVAVGCNETVTAPPSTGPTASSAQFYRGAPLDKQGTTPCSDVGATVQIIDGGPCVVGTDRPGCVFFDNTSTGVNGSTQAVSGTLTINWAPVPQNKLAWLNRQIDYDAGGPLNFVDVQWCADDDADVSTANGTDFNVTTPSGVPWCLISDVRVLNSDGKIVQTQVYYGQGDPWNR